MRSRYCCRAFSFLLNAIVFAGASCLRQKHQLCGTSRWKGTQVHSTALWRTTRTSGPPEKLKSATFLGRRSRSSKRKVIGAGVAGAPSRKKIKSTSNIRFPGLLVDRTTRGTCTRYTSTAIKYWLNTLTIPSEEVAATRPVRKGTATCRMLQSLSWLRGNPHDQFWVGKDPVRSLTYPATFSLRKRNHNENFRISRTIMNLEPWPLTQRDLWSRARSSPSWINYHPIYQYSVIKLLTSTDY